MTVRPDIWMPLYVGDWERKTKHLDCEQDGAYGRLIRHYWVNGPLPDDDASLARIVGMDRSRWRKTRGAVAPFFQIKEGKWFHERVEEELERAKEIIEKRRKAGLASGQKRRTHVGTHVATHVPTQHPTHDEQNAIPARVEVDRSEITQEPIHDLELDSQVSSTNVVKLETGR